MTTKVLLDTDIGSDIDDAVCLAYLLAQSDCELLGITTVSGEVTKRAMIASALCKAAGRQVPIVPGAEDPLLVPQRQTKAPQAAALSRWPHDTSFRQGEAVSFMRALIHDHPGEITLLCIGPLTNVALLFALDREIPSLLKELVLMCGVFVRRRSGVGLLEWNALLDPHATAIVYQAQLASHRSIGLDVTAQVRMPASEVRQKFQTESLRPVLDFAEVWFRDQTELVFHDPLAAAILFNDTICGFDEGTVEVELTSPRLLGLTHWLPGSHKSRHQIATSVDATRFFEHFFSVTG